MAKKKKEDAVQEESLNQQEQTPEEKIATEQVEQPAENPEQAADEQQNTEKPSYEDVPQDTEESSSEEAQAEETSKEPEDGPVKAHSEADALNLLYKSIVGCDMPSNVNKYKVVKDMWLVRRPGKPFPGYDVALKQLVK